MQTTAETISSVKGKKESAIARQLFDSKRPVQACMMDGVEELTRRKSSASVDEIEKRIEELTLPRIGASVNESLPTDLYPLSTITIPDVYALPSGFSTHASLDFSDNPFEVPEYPIPEHGYYSSNHLSEELETEPLQDYPPQSLGFCYNPSSNNLSEPRTSHSFATHHKADSGTSCSNASSRDFSTPRNSHKYRSRRLASLYGMKNYFDLQWYSLSQVAYYPCTFGCRLGFKSVIDWTDHEIWSHYTSIQYNCPECMALSSNDRDEISAISYQDDLRTCEHFQKGAYLNKKQRYWGCGFCHREKGYLATSWIERQNHVVRHINNRDIISHWSFTTLVLGLLKQPYISDCWSRLLLELHGTSCPAFAWDEGNILCQKVARDLELGSRSNEENFEIVKMAYILGVRGPSQASNKVSSSDDMITELRIVREPSRLGGKGESDILSCLKTILIRALSDKQMNVIEQLTGNFQLLLPTELKHFGHFPGRKMSIRTKSNSHRDSDVNLPPESWRLLCKQSAASKVVPEEQSESLHVSMGSYALSADTQWADALDAKFTKTPQHSSAGGSSSQQSSGSKRQTVSELSNKRQYHRRGKNDRLPSDEEDDKDDNKKKRRCNQIPEASKRDVRKYACPFYIRDPLRYAGEQSCPGPGWDEVRRVKEHIYARHKKPEQCPVCSQAFTEREECDRHIRERRCLPKTPIVLDGIDKCQKGQLRCRKPVSGVETEVEKWKYMWKILFPFDVESDIPEPYYPCHQTCYETARRKSEMTSIDNIERFITRNLHDRLNPRLMVFEQCTRIDSNSRIFLLPFEERPWMNLIGLLRAVITEMAEEYRRMNIYSVDTNASAYAIPESSRSSALPPSSETQSGPVLSSARTSIVNSSSECQPSERHESCTTSARANPRGVHRVFDNEGTTLRGPSAANEPFSFYSAHLMPHEPAGFSNDVEQTRDQHEMSLAPTYDRLNVETSNTAISPSTAEASSSRLTSIAGNSTAELGQQHPNEALARTHSSPSAGGRWFPSSPPSSTLPTSNMPSRSSSSAGQSMANNADTGLRLSDPLAQRYASDLDLSGSTNDFFPMFAGPAGTDAPSELALPKPAVQVCICGTCPDFPCENPDHLVDADPAWQLWPDATADFQGG